MWGTNIGIEHIFIKNRVKTVYTTGVDSSNHTCYWAGTVKTTLDNSGGKQCLSLSINFKEKN